MKQLSMSHITGTSGFKLRALCNDRALTYGYVACASTNILIQGSEWRLK